MRVGEPIGLLSREVEALFAPGGPAREEHRQLVVLSTAEAVAVIGGPELPGEVTEELEVLTAAAAPAVNPLDAPPVLDECLKVLSHGTASSTLLACSGPSYLVTDELARTVAATIECSGGDGARRLFSANPGNWQPDEWAALVGGELGPWAMAIDDAAVVSMCHTSVLTEDVAEAGTWTRSDHRGRGLAAATTAAWAELLRPSVRWRFYSTSATNLSSQAVARRLGLPLLGALWWFGAT